MSIKCSIGPWWYPFKWHPRQLYSFTWLVFVLCDNYINVLGHVIAFVPFAPKPFVFLLTSINCFWTYYLLRVSLNTYMYETCISIWLGKTEFYTAPLEDSHHYLVLDPLLHLISFHLRSLILVSDPYGSLVLLWFSFLFC